MNTLKEIFLFFLRALSGMWKRVLILALGILVGFAGPLLTLPHLPPWYARETWIWDAFAADAYSHKEYKDVIIGILPAPFVCFTDFMNHILDDEYRYSHSHIGYNGLFLILAFLIITVAMLPYSYAAISNNSDSWLAEFSSSWYLVKLIIIGAFIFEIALAFLEELRRLY